MHNINKFHKISGNALSDFNFTESKFIISGAGGWIGTATLDLLNQKIPHLSERTYCFGSKKKDIHLLDGSVIKQNPLSEIKFLKSDENYVMFNFAFLTPDKLKKENLSNYLKINRDISKTLFREAKRLKIQNIATISSGSVYQKDSSLHSKVERNPYGVLKLEEENLFSSLAEKGSCVVIPRVFNISGPYLSNFDLYMLSSLIKQAALGKEIEIKSSYKVVRSFVSIAELISIIFGIFNKEKGGKTFVFDTAGEAELEIGELALKVKKQLNSGAKIFRPELSKAKTEDRYIGNRQKYLTFLEKYNIPSISIDDQILCTYEYMKPFITGK